MVVTILSEREMIMVTLFTSGLVNWMEAIVLPVKNAFASPGRTLAAVAKVGLKFTYF